MKKFFVLLALFLMFSETVVPATHERGKLVCSDCHNMHEGFREQSDLESVATGTMYPSLLAEPKKDNAVCLACHDDRADDKSGAPTVYSVNNLEDTYYPGGDFDGAGTHGVNGHFKTTGRNLVADDDPATAPGSNGTVNSSDIACWSCHAPHNRPDETNDFRLLRLRPINATTGVSYVTTDIRVIAKPAEYENESGANHTVYNSGISEWCSACHSNPDNMGTGFYGSTVSDSDVGSEGKWHRHPVDNTFSSEYAAEYNAAADTVTADWEVPFEDDAGDWAPNSATHNSTVSDRVMCLSCHRAHVGRSTGGVSATYFRDGLRWNPDCGVGSDSGCNKCHNK